MPDFRVIDAGSVRIRVAVEGTGPLVLMVHGFPESWFSWRRQMGSLAAAGFTAAAMDVRGYGGSDRPEPVEAYDMEALVGDVLGVAQALQPGAPTILAGHDWGAPIVWNTTLTHPDRVAAVVALSVPFTGVPRRPALESFRQAFTDKGHFFYQEWFQQVGPAESEAEADVARYLRILFGATSGDAVAGGMPHKPAGARLLDGMTDPGRPPSWLTQVEFDYYVGELQRSGFRGPLNRYRNSGRDHAWLQPYAGRRVEAPALFIGGRRDPATTLFGALQDPVEAMRPHVGQLEAHVLEGCGHWTQQEQPEQVTELMLEWLARLPH